MSETVIRSFPFLARYFFDLEEAGLTDRQLGSLIRAMGNYQFRGIDIRDELSPECRCIWILLRRDLDQAKARYQASVQNGRKRTKTNPEETQANPSQPSRNPAKPESESKTESKSESKTESKTESKSESKKTKTKTESSFSEEKEYIPAAKSGADEFDEVEPAKQPQTQTLNRSDHQPSPTLRAPPST